MNINATLFLQIIVFAVLVWFTMKFVWPPIAKVLDDRVQKITDGLAQADKAHYELETAHKKATEEMESSRTETVMMLADAERRAVAIVEEAKTKAHVESDRIIAAAQVEAQLQAVQVREALRAEVAILAMKGAEKILCREISPAVHGELLTQLETEL